MVAARVMPQSTRYVRSRSGDRRLVRLELPDVTLGGVEAVGELALGQPREQASLLECVPELFGTSCRPGVLHVDLLL